MKSYDHVISLGFFCSVAQELITLGLRERSGPFDWLISDFKGVLELIDKEFVDFLNPVYLERSSQIGTVYFNKKYGINFFHDFVDNKDMVEQLNDISEKYNRRIKNFYTDIKDKTLFIRYIKDQSEYDYIDQNIKHILSFLKKFNIYNNILFIANSDIETKNLYVYKVDKDYNDVVARHFLSKNKELQDYLNNLK